MRFLIRIDGRYIKKLTRPVLLGLLLISLIVYGLFRVDSMHTRRVEFMREEQANYEAAKRNQEEVEREVAVSSQKLEIIRLDVMEVLSFHKKIEKFR